MKPGEFMKNLPVQLRTSSTERVFLVLNSNISVHRRTARKHIYALAILLGLSALPTQAAATAFIIVSSGLDAEFGGAPISDSKSVNSTMQGFSTQQSVGVARAGALSQASVDLVTGSLRGLVDTRGVSQKGSFTSALTENFTFSVAGAGSDTLTPMGLRVYFDGSLLGSNPVNTIEFRVDLRSNINTPFVATDIGIVNLGTNSMTVRYPGFSSNSFPISRSGPDQVTGVVDFVIPFMLRGNSSLVELSASVTGTAQSGSLVTFSNSAHLGFILPQDVGFTSSSGTSLTASAFPIGVPEPASWAMLIMGFGLVGAMARRQRLARS